MKKNQLNALFYWVIIQAMISYNSYIREKDVLADSC